MATFTLAALAAEINNDAQQPANLQYGYAGKVSSGDDSGIAALLNGPTKTVNPTVWKSNVRAADLLACIVWGEVSAFAATKIAWVQALLSTDFVDATNANIRGMFAGIFAGTATTLSAMTALSKVTAPTRAEELWGAGFTVDSSMVAAALGRS